MRLQSVFLRNQCFGSLLNSNFGLLCNLSHSFCLSKTKWLRIFYQNVTFFLALNSFFVYFKTQGRLLYYMLHMQINLKTWEIKVLCCNTYILGMQFNPIHRPTATNSRKLPHAEIFQNTSLCPVTSKNAQS